MSSKEISRRKIIQGGLTLAGLIAVGAKALLPESAFAQRAKAGGGTATPATGGAAGGVPTLVSESDPTAKALNYHHEHKNVPKELQTERTGVPFKDQMCKNCTFFKDPIKIGKDAAGTCQVIASGKVKETGWCTSWTKKA